MVFIAQERSLSAVAGNFVQYELNYELCQRYDYETNDGVDNRILCT